MTCATPLVLAALSGAAPAHHPGVLAPPFGLDAPAPPPASGKALWGEALDNEVASTNFAVGWADDDGTQAAADRVLVALEGAWAVLVEDQAWLAPAVSEDHLLRVVLDRSLGHTGYTTLIADDDYPRGVPLIYLNPDYASYGTFWEHLAIHEFSHMLQYAVRDYTGGDGESWYWEASAEWTVELSAPELDVYVVQTRGYTDAPELAYDTIDGRHEYGMVLLNAWLEEHVLGEGGLRQVWDHAATRAGDDWLDVLADTTGLDPGSLWAGFTGALANGGLRESELYELPEVQGDADDDSSSRLDELGTDYWRMSRDALVTVDGDAVAGTGSESGRSVVALGGEIVTITALEHNARYTLRLSDVPHDTGPTDSADPQDTDSTGTTSLPDDPGLACGCSSAEPRSAAWPWLVLVAAMQRRRSRVARSARARV